jgi:hypothetical protein
MPDGHVASDDRPGVDLGESADRDLALQDHGRVDVGGGIDVHLAL